MDNETLLNKILNNPKLFKVLKELNILKVKREIFETEDKRLTIEDNYLVIR